MPSAHIVLATEANFQDTVLNSDVPVLVDFWATWCGPCKAIAPLLDQLADEQFPKAKVAKLDVDSNRRIAMQYGVTSIPTLLVFKGGKEVGRKVGTGGGLPELRKLVTAHV
jgi:thioredoxin